MPTTLCHLIKIRHHLSLNGEHMPTTLCHLIKRRHNLSLNGEHMPTTLCHLDCVTLQLLFKK